VDSVALSFPAISCFEDLRKNFRQEPLSDGLSACTTPALSANPVGLTRARRGPEIESLPRHANELKHQSARVARPLLTSSVLPTSFRDRFPEPWPRPLLLDAGRSRPDRLREAEEVIRIDPLLCGHEARIV
jgi:hypothetical protein